MKGYVIGYDTSLTNCGCAVLSFDGSAIDVVSTRCLNLNTKRGIDSLFSLLNMLKGSDIPIVGFSFEDNPFDSAHGRSQKEGQRIARGQELGIGFIRGIMVCFGIENLGGTNCQTAKAALCKGNATKDDMIRAVKIRYGIEVNEHEADAVAVALAQCKRIHLESLSKEQSKMRL